MSEADPQACTYAFDEAHLQALWLEFQAENTATCPVTGARITLELTSAAPAPPMVRAHCAQCGRERSFHPGNVEGLGWAE